MFDNAVLTDENIDSWDHVRTNGSPLFVWMIELQLCIRIAELQTCVIVEERFNSTVYVLALH